MDKKNKAEMLANRKNAVIWGGLSFVVPAVVMLLVFVICGIAPFGKTTLISDVNLDWFEGFQAFYQSITESESIFYLFNTGFGSSFYSDFVSGLCSPFMFVALFFKGSELASAYSIITVLRAGFAGYFAWLMLRKITGCSAHCSFAVACGYALCGFTACSLYYPSIADCAVFFPLLVMGIHSYVYEARPIYLFIFGTLFFITSPTMLISGLLMSFVLYMAFYFKRGSKRQRIYKFATFSAMTICSAAVAAILIIPAGASALYYEGGLFSDVSVMSFEEILPSLCFGSFATSIASETGFFCLSGMLIMGTAAFMFNGKINLGERLTLLVGIIINLLSSVIMPIGTAFFGLCQPENEFFNSAFILALIAAYCTARNFTESKDIRTWSIAVSAGLFVLCSGISLVMFGNDIFSIVAEIGIAVVFVALFVKVCYDRESPSVKTSAVITAVILLFSMTICCDAVIALNEKYPAEIISADADSRTSTIEEISATEKQKDRALDFFRYRSVDDSAANGANLNQNVIQGFSDFARQLGIVDRDCSGGGANFTPLTDFIFGVRYVIKDDKVIYESDLSLSPAYKSDQATFINSDELNPFEFQNQIAEEWLGVKNLFIPAEYTQGDKTTSAESEKYKWTFGNKTTAVSKYMINLNEGDRLYILTEDCDYGFAVNDDSRSSWREACKGGIYELISADAQKEVEVYISHDIAIEAVQPIFMKISAANIDLLKAEATQRSAEYISRRGNKIKFMINCETSQTAVTSIPYEYGWNVTVNGESTEITEIQGALIGINLQPGSNSIVMEYQPPFFKVGMIVTIVMFMMGLYMAVFTEHEAYRRRKVRMAFRAVELNLERQSAAKMQKLRENVQRAVKAENQSDMNKLSDDEKEPYDEVK